MQYYLFLWGSRLVPRLPRWFLGVVVGIAGTLAWLLARPARRMAIINAQHVLGPSIRDTAAGRRRLRRVVRGMFYSSVTNYLEAFLVPSLSSQDVERRLSVSGEEHLQEALASGKGAILFSAHLGPFEYMANWFKINRYQMIIPVENLVDKRLLDLMLRLRNASGVTYVPLGGTAPMRKIIHALRENQLVMITADRAVEGESVIRDFFCAPARLPIGPVMLSIRTGAPLVGAVGWRVPGGKIEAEFTRLTLALPEEERKQPDKVEDAVLKALERAIGAHPEQWPVFSKIWENQEELSS